MKFSTTKKRLDIGDVNGILVVSSILVYKGHPAGLELSMKFKKNGREEFFLVKLDNYEYEHLDQGKRVLTKTSHNNPLWYDLRDVKDLQIIATGGDEFEFSIYFDFKR